MFIRALLLGIISGLLAGVASVVYRNFLYVEATGEDFAKIISTSHIFIGSVVGGLLAAVGYTFFVKILKGYGEIAFNLIFVVLSFASLLKVVAFQLDPKEYDTPGLFIGLAAPMHLFPALGWFTLKPLFFKSSQA